MKKALIYDLDNTIYAVSSIGPVLFAPLFELLASSELDAMRLPAIQHDIMRKPFQVVAAQHQFGDALTAQALHLLHELRYEGPIAPYEDWAAIRQLPGTRFLVTTGFHQLQYSKIEGMGLTADFAEVHVVDPAVSPRTKRDVFADIMARHGYAPAEVLVIGDDLDSEIKAAQALGIDTVLYDRDARYPGNSATYTIARFTELARVVAHA